MDFLYSLFTRNSVQTSVDNKKANASVVVSTNVEHDYLDGRSSPSSAICDEFSESVSSHGSVLDFFGSGKMNRPDFTPITMNGVRKIKYVGMQDSKFHMFKVWYDEISDARFDVRDYEELVGKYPYLVDSCVQEIRLGHREVAKPVKVLGAKCNTKDFKVGTKKFDQSEALNVFRHRSKYCVLHSFLLTMNMEEDVRDYMMTTLSGERTDLTKVASFLMTEGIVLKSTGKGDKLSWLFSEAEPGKYLAAGNSHAVGVLVNVDKSVTILDPAERSPVVGSKRSLQSCIGFVADEIRMIIDLRKKRAKSLNKLNKMCV